MAAKSNWNPTTTGRPAQLGLRSSDGSMRGPLAARAVVVRAADSSCRSGRRHWDELADAVRTMVWCGPKSTAVAAATQLRAEPGHRERSCVLPEFDTRSDQVTGQPPPPSPLATSQRPYRIQPSRAERNLHGASPRAGSLYVLQNFTAFLQFLGEHYPTTRHDEVIYFEAEDLIPKGWKAVPAALDRNQPTTVLSNGNLTHPYSLYT
jgi:hypothetical protein